MNKRNIAVIVALIVVFGLILVLAPKGNVNGQKEGFSFFSDFSNMFSGSVPTLNDSFNATVAWATFQDYLKYAKENDLEGVKSLSHQISPTCSNPATEEECKGLMNGVYRIAQGFKLEDFKNVAYDDKQIIMSTNYMDPHEGANKTKVVLYFVKSEEGKPKVLGIRFCYGEESEGECTNINPDIRDSDKDGWWDDIEELFYN